MADLFQPLKSTGANPTGDTPGDQPQPQPGQTSRLAAKLAAKASGAKDRPAPIISAPGTKGGRRSIPEETAAYLASRGEVAVPAQTAGAVGIAPVQPAYVVTPEFIKDVSAKLLDGIDNWRQTQIGLRVKTLCGDDKLAKEFSNSAGAPPGCIKTISESMGELAKKYPAMLQWAPELAILGAASTWIAKDQATSKKLKELEKRLVDSGAIQPKPAPTATPKPATN
jgi:hypothetical protein